MPDYPYWTKSVMTPEEKRRRSGIIRIALGVGLLLLVIVITIIILPIYSR